MKKIVLALLFLSISFGLCSKSISLSPKGNGKDDRGAIMNALKSVDTLYLNAGEFILKNEPVLINSFLPRRLVIIGKGMEQTRIKGTEKGAFVISNAKQAHHVTIKGLTIADGLRNAAGTDKGGGILVETKGGSLTLDDVAVRNCTALGGGGAIAISGTNTSLKNCCLTENKVTSDNQYAGFGGAIYFYANAGYADETPETTLTVDNCLISKNESLNSGGGICIFGNAKFGEKMKIKLDLKNSTIAYNKSGKNGGGIYVAAYKHTSGEGGNASVDIDNSIIAYNEAVVKSAVGLSFGATGLKPVLNMTNTTLTLNGTSAGSTGIFDSDLGLAQIGSKFADNKIGKANGFSISNSYSNIKLNFFKPADIDLNCKHPALASQQESSKVELIASTTDKKDFPVGINYGGLLAPMLQSNMVVQQGKPFTLWGNAPRGLEVKVKADWTMEQSVISGDNGVWEIKVDVPTVRAGDFTPHSIIITSGSERIQLDNILIGEVWLFSGQSNMSMSMKPFKPWHNGILNYEKEIAAANYPYLRLYRNEGHSTDKALSSAERRFSAEPQNLTIGTWQACKPETVADFSAVAYVFAQKIHQETNLPVGIIESALGAMSCQAYTPAETLKEDDILRKKYWDPYIANPDMPVGTRPSQLYNGIIHPFIKLSIKGFGWYQGENNAGHYDIYPLLNSKMIESWRNKFGQGELSFYSVQLTPYSWSPKNPAAAKFYGGTYAYFREAQEKICEIVPGNVDLVSTMDAGDIASVHPSDKRPVGERMAALALHYDYGKKGVFKGPQYKDIEIKGNKAIISFKPETIGSGLNTKDGQVPQHFYIAGADKVFYKAQVTINNNNVELVSSEVTTPVAVRYAFLTFPITNFQNKEGFAAYPFRTDDWKDVKYSDAK